MLICVAKQLVKQKKQKNQYKTGVSSVQFSPLTNWVVGMDMRNDSEEVLVQSFLQEALESSSSI